MKLEKCREAYSDYSGRASDVARQLAFAAIGVAWLFKGEGRAIPAEEAAVRWMLFRALGWSAVSLALDLLQYAYAAAAWGLFCWFREKAQMKRDGVLKDDEECEVPSPINWPTFVFFWVKLVTLAIAYSYLARFLASSGVF